jgi:hypothetical protein
MKLMELIRKEIKTAGKSRNVISAETGVNKAVLCRIMQDGSCKAETVEILLAYFGYSITKGKRG